MRFDLFPFKPQIIEARWILRILPSEEVPQIAQKALELGYDGKNIARIAGLNHPTNADLLSLFSGFLAELGANSIQSQNQAGWVLAEAIAQGICDGWVEPYDGARFIWREIVNRLWPNQQHRLLSFVGNASKYEDCESYSDQPERTRREIAKEIIKDARELLAERTQRV